MIRTIDIQQTCTLEDYAASGHLTHAVRTLQKTARRTVGGLDGRTVWMVNSTATGGGVAEMLPKLVSLLRELGVRTEWAVIESTNPAFFDLTKRIHNLLHGAGDPALGAEERALYEAESRRFFEAFRQRIGPDDLLVVHDPQPLAMGAMLKEALGVPAVWRCHIGLDEESAQTRAAWRFLEPWASAYDRTVFTVADYVPPFLRGRATIIPPAVDPFSDKNRELSVHKVAGVLANAGLVDAAAVTVPAPFSAPAMRLQRDGSFAAAHLPEDLDVLHRPVVLQVSRWDRLKGWPHLLEGFARLKQQRHARSLPAVHRRRLDLARLVLAGPDPASVKDDPEGLEVFETVCRRWQGLDPDVQKDVAVLVLPMGSRRENALMVNALQRCATVVAQNSLREGFGLTVTEAMWKGCAVMGSPAVGIREQIDDDVHGRLVADPTDAAGIAATLDEMLANPARRDVWGRSARQRVLQRFLVFSQAAGWLEVLDRVRDYDRSRAA